jgi:predicted RNA-binding Zn ribbon-like protein
MVRQTFSPVKAWLLVRGAARGYIGPVSDHRFVLVGGDPALDFLDTIHDWTAAEPRDHLADFSDALRFGEAAGLLARAEARRLAAEAGAGPGELRRLRDLRARLERIFRAAVGGRAPDAADLEALARETAEAARGARLRATRGGFERTIDVGATGAATLRGRIAEAAVALLTSPRLERVKSCPSCGWYFLDTSRNGSRRWCSMAMCGDAAKARSYYWRTKGKGRSARGAPGPAR